MGGVTMTEAVINNIKALICLGTLAFFGVVVFFLMLYSDRKERKKRDWPKRW